jgi:uncharacterized cupin superfamily protein
MSDWFVVNVRDARWRTHHTFGASCRFETPEAPFEQLGVNIRVLQPGQPNCLYHSENLQEDFLVLAGECFLLVEEQERLLRAWDFVHCPPWTLHTFVGAGDRPCAILMVGRRNVPDEVVYPVSEVAARRGAAVARETTSPEEAYASRPEWRLERPDLSGMPWA